MEPSRNEDDTRRRFQELFDLRYVMRQGEYELIRKGFFGFVILILIAVITGIISLVIKTT